MQSSQIMWYIVVIGIAGVASLLIAVWATRGFRKRIGSESPTETAFTLDELRRMLSEGMITHKEYDHLKARIIKRMKAASASQAEEKRQISAEANYGENGDDSEEVSK